MSPYNLSTDHQYGFRQSRSKAFDRVWHKALIFRLPSNNFRSSLCNFTSSFLSDRSIAGVIDGRWSSFKCCYVHVEPEPFVVLHSLVE